MSVHKDAPWSKDKMQRRGVAKFLTKYLDSNVEINVLNVNAPWGAGKTFFLENWYGELREERAVIYFNAWKHDYAGDAFVALTAAIHDALKEFIPTAQVDSALSDFRSKAARAILAATPAIAKGVLKKVTGVDVSTVAEDVDAAESEASADDDALLPTAAEKALEALLQSNGQTMRIVDDFKIKFSALAKEAAEAQAVCAAVEVRPLYIFIDELDRCRPTFSIELLERVKHFFDVKGCKFVIACDLEQLQHSVGAVYGAGFEGGKYLKRFFDAEYSLDYSRTEGWVKAQEFDAEKYLDIPVCSEAVDRSLIMWDDERQRVASPSSNSVLAGVWGFDKFQIILLAISSTFGMKLRELEKCLKHLRAVQSSLYPKQVDLFFAMYLIALRDQAPQLYRRVIERNDVEDWRAIKAKYPSKALYYGYGNENVHDLAVNYFSLLSADPEEVRRRSRDSDDAPSLSNYVLEQFLGRESHVNMRRYISYVDLAHSIE